MVQELFVIGERLRGHFASLAAALQVTFSDEEIERVFQDNGVDQVSEKAYAFFDTKNLQVVGKVDSYESESIWIQVQGNRHSEAVFQRMIEDLRLLIGPNRVID